MSLPPSNGTRIAAALLLAFGVGAACGGEAAEHGAEHAAEPKAVGHKPEPAGEGKAKAEAKSEAKVEARAEAKAEAKVEAKAEHKSDAKSEAKPEPKMEAKAERKASAAANAEAAPAHSGNVEARMAAVEARGPRDPMDLLRERLAAKLGAAKVANAPDPNLMRVTSKATLTEREPLTLAAPHAVRRKPAAPAPAAHAAHWDYGGSAEGPKAWAELNPEFSKCSTGTRQSPIDIREGIKVDLEQVKFDYRPSSFRVIDNGHTVQVNVASGNTIEVTGKTFELLQFHFHRPSEERIDGKQFDMVAHLVHKDLEGHLAVVAVLLERGAAQTLIQSVWNNLPLEKGEEVAARTPINLSELLPIDRSYYTYMGSLTTPPCSEGVLWMVMKKPVQLSPDQLAIFARLYPMNARPIQSASGRMIKESN